ncbi:MAG TPA: hypothetical protein VJ782_02255 [Aeromicrobium sp.]|nr:hypothetical protein [Aeromicrobium sp.]
MPDVNGNTIAVGFIAATALIAAAGALAMRWLDRRVTGWANVTDQDAA